MKRHISIFTFLLGAFAAGFASEAGAAGQTVYGGYYYYEQAYQGTRSFDRMYVEGSKPASYTAQDIADGAQVTFVAVPPPAMVVSGWGIATSGTAVQKISEWTGSTSPSYVWTGKPADGDRYLAVKFAYVQLDIAFSGGDGGSGSMAKMTGLNVDSEFTLPANEFTKTGYRFNGWKTNETKGVVFADKATLKGSAFWNGKAFDSTLYAQWTTNAYSVSCEVNGGAWPAGYNPPVRAVYDTVFSLPAPTRIGYDFIGWKVTSGLDTTTAKWGTDKNPATPITVDTRCVNDEKDVFFKNLNPANDAVVALTAQWQASTITVTFNNHGGTSGGGLLDTLKVTYDAAYPALNPPAKDGHDFMGYAIGAEAYWGADGQPTKATWDIPTDCTADAQWEAKVYQVTYHENRSDGKPSMTFVTNVTYGIPTTLYDGAGFSNFGCVLLGWSTSQGTKSPDEGFALGGSVSFDGPKTLYAVWEKSYFIAYDGNGATGGTPMETSRFVIGKEGQALAPNTYAKTGYSFFGWATNRAAALLLDRKYADRATLPPDIGVGQGETNTLFAVWATNTYYVAFDSNGGTGPAMPVLTNTYDTAFKLPKATYSNGAYDFAGWRDDVAGVVYTNLNESVSNLCTVANGTNTLTAVWELNPLSAAMHCGNLRWELGQNQQSLANNPWKPLVGAGVGHGSDSCVRQTGASTSSQYWLVAQVDTTGSLSFSWKPTGCDGVLRFWVGPKKDDFSLDALRLSGTDGSWSTFSTNDVPANSWLHFYFLSSTGYCDIDRMTWTPEGFVPVTNAVPVAATGLVYDGTVKTGVATGAGYMIEGNRATGAGDYTATATLTDGYVWEGGSQAPTNISWTIAKATYDMGGVTFASATYEADGTAKSIFVSGALPSGVTVAYEGNGQTEPGTYTVTAKFAGDAKNYEAIPDKTAKLTILKKEDPPVPPEPVITNAIPAAITGLIYDGAAKTGVMAGANYTIIGNVATDAGDYTATATVTNGVWEGGAKGATNIAWTIAKATYDMGGVTFTNGTYEADGTAKSIFVSGALPSGVTVAYEGNGQTEPGTYTVTAKFAGDAKNYEAIPDKTAKLTILKKEDPPDPTVAYENIYFRATLAELGAEAVPTNRKITIKAEGLPKGLKLVTTALKDAKKKATGYYAYTVEGAPTETMDGLSRIAYVRVTDNKVQTLYALDLSVLWAKAYEEKSFPDGEIKSEYANFSVTNLWPDIAVNPKNWTFSGWPAGIKYATKVVTSRKKINKVYVTLTNALPYEIYGTPTKAGRFTVKATEKIVGTSYKSTHVATITIWPEGSGPAEEWTDQAYVNVYRGSATDVKSASGLPTGIKFTAKDIKSKGVVVTEAHHFYGKPTKAGTFAVTLTHDDKSKTQFLWTITPAAAPAFELKLTETAVDPATAKATIRQGVSYEWAVDNTLGSKVSASGLPSGLSLKSTAIKDGKTTIGYAYSVKGVPTKAGEYFVTFKTTMNGVTTVTTAAFTVLDLPAWAQGTFNGGADGSFPSGGQAKLTLSKVGKLSGKWMSQGTNWTLNAASYDRYDPESGSYVALMIGKSGSGKKAVTFTNELVVSKADGESLGGVATNALFIGYQNVWKAAPWKAIGKKFTKGGTVVLHPGVVGTNDTITLKFAASGTVTVAGKFEKSVSSKGKVSYYSVSASAVLCPQGDPDEYGAFTGVVFVYFPPKAKTPLSGGYSACVWVHWNGSSFAEVPL